jgi:uncharacterized membrane protein
MEVIIAYVIGSIVTLLLSWRHFSMLAIENTIAYLCNNGYLANRVDVDGELELVTVEEVISDTIKSTSTIMLPNNEV